LRNFLIKRLSKRAFPQIQTLARMMYDNIPKEFKFLFNVWELKKVDITNLTEKAKLSDMIFISNPNQAYTNMREIVQELISKELYEKEYLV
jgi:thymidylate synthase ThyX